ncbi:multidrug efflux SMR transporter [Metabacillus idriensis]|uniref:QacE family quaternary ammonium compound efflux SMR transporter n=1 Tax=Metabacillus idriensis TaxID=324768 RepID=A0A6I2MB77_9BACI|nr:multidrug efflux SMR transporter [Metabacillus idriensis]MCM3597612.1 multidrug efflux SMR transporter [Metabacillus idriensis]MRX54532.1 QacE family quaternary ammonium compound efflux SMR transporter [Metabacillus idriensis]OHR65743.1 transporter [Bacillus sp. HMSC76G11]
MDWILLIAAGLFEVVGVIGINKMKDSKGTVPLLIMIAGFSFSFLLLNQSLQTISLGTAYSVWTGIGSAGSALVGILFYGDSSSWKRILFISMIISATVGLKLVS